MTPDLSLILTLAETPRLAWQAYLLAAAVAVVSGMFWTSWLRPRGFRAMIWALGAALAFAPVAVLPLPPQDEGVSRVPSIPKMPMDTQQRSPEAWAAVRGADLPLTQALLPNALSEQARVLLRAEQRAPAVAGVAVGWFGKDRAALVDSLQSIALFSLLLWPLCLLLNGLLSLVAPQQQPRSEADEADAA